MRSENLVAAISLGIVLVLVILLFLLPSVLLPLLIALVLAYALNPVVERMGSWRIGRSLAILFILVACGGFLFLLGLLIAPWVQGQGAALADKMPGYVMAVQERFLPSLERALGVQFPRSLREGLTGLTQISGVTLPSLQGLIGKAFSSLINLVAFGLSLILIPVYAFYLLRDLRKFEAGVLSCIPAGCREVVLGQLREAGHLLKSFAAGQLGVAVILGVLYSIGLFIIGLDFGPVIGFFSGLLNIVPYLGLISGLMVATLVAGIQFRDLLHPILVVGIFAIVQALEGSVITPRIVGRRVGLHPVVVILSILIGGNLFGILGILVAVPVVAVLSVFTRGLRSEVTGPTPYC